MAEKKSKTRYIKPPNILKQKVGGGGLPVETIEKGEKVISNNNVDFIFFADKYLGEMNNILGDLERKKLKSKDAGKKLAEPVMELKANGGMFGYELITRISDIVLLLLDNITELNDDALKIIKAHQNSVHIIVGGRLRGTGGREGRMLERELTDACRRYYKKYKIKPE
jgi:hypothetical protein